MEGANQTSPVIIDEVQKLPTLLIEVQAMMDRKGIDAIIVEVHCNPDKALSDGAQSLYPDQFKALMDQLRIIAQAVGRTIA